MLCEDQDRDHYCTRHYSNLWNQTVQFTYMQLKYADWTWTLKSEIRLILHVKQMNLSSNRWFNKNDKLADLLASRFLRLDLEIELFKFRKSSLYRVSQERAVCRDHRQYSRNRNKCCNPPNNFYRMSLRIAQYQKRNLKFWPLSSAENSRCYSAIQGALK